MVRMLLAKIECKNVTVEKLADYLADLTEPSFRVWLYDKKIYAIFRVSSIVVLKQLIEKLKQVKGLEFRFFRIEEVGI
jgi:hypothetical protein